MLLVVTISLAEQEENDVEHNVWVRVVQPNWKWEKRMVFVSLIFIYNNILIIFFGSDNFIFFFLNIKDENKTKIRDVYKIWNEEKLLVGRDWVQLCVASKPAIFV